MIGLLLGACRALVLGRFNGGAVLFGILLLLRIFALLRYNDGLVRPRILLVQAALANRCLSLNAFAFKIFVALGRYPAFNAYLRLLRLLSLS